MFAKIQRVHFVDSGAELRQAISNCAAPQVRARDFESEIQQHLGDTAHADATDSYKMHALDLRKHVARCWLLVASLTTTSCCLPPASCLPRSRRPFRRSHGRHRDAQAASQRRPYWPNGTDPVAKRRCFLPEVRWKVVIAS